MCHASDIVFVWDSIERHEIEGRRVLEVGSRIVNGSVRPSLERMNPREYVGVDIEEGPGVDVVLDAVDLEERFGRGSFDVVISTEMLEHAWDWERSVRAMKAVCKPGGLLLITTRSEGFPFHAFPHDHWRYSLEDFEAIFADTEILTLQPDPGAPGVFLKTRVPSDFRLLDLRTRPLYNIVLGRKARLDDPGLLNPWGYRARTRVAGLREWTGQSLYHLRGLPSCFGRVPVLVPATPTVSMPHSPPGSPVGRPSHDHPSALAIPDA